MIEKLDQRKFRSAVTSTLVAFDKAFNAYDSHQLAAIHDDETAIENALEDARYLELMWKTFEKSGSDEITFQMLLATTYLSGMRAAFKLSQSHTTAHSSNE